MNDHIITYLYLHLSTTEENTTNKTPTRSNSIIQNKILLCFIVVTVGIYDPCVVKLDFVYGPRITQT